MNRPLLLCLLLLLSLTDTSAQDFRNVDAWLQRNIESLGGRAVLLIHKDGQQVYSQSLNDMSRRQQLGQRLMARRQKTAPGTEDFDARTKIPIASCSKWLSAALVMTFIDEGTLKLSDTIGRWLPVMSRAGRGKITIAQCLSHSTGLNGGKLRENLEAMRDFRSMDDAVNHLATVPVEGAPGTVFHYGNTGLQLAAAVLEKISGRSFTELFDERIARPLNMTETDWGTTRVPLPAGGARSSASDYAKFLEMIRRGGTVSTGNSGNRRLLSEQSLRAMRVNRITEGIRISHTPARDSTIAGYGFGCWVPPTATERSPAALATSPGLFGSFPWVSFEKGYTAVLFVYNLRAKERPELYRELRTLVDQAMR